MKTKLAVLALATLFLEFFSSRAFAEEKFVLNSPTELGGHYNVKYGAKFPSSVVLDPMMPGYNIYTFSGSLTYTITVEMDYLNFPSPPVICLGKYNENNQWETKEVWKGEGDGKSHFMTIVSCPLDLLLIIEVDGKLVLFEKLKESTGDEGAEERNQ